MFSYLKFPLVKIIFLPSLITGRRGIIQVLSLRWQFMPRWRSLPHFKLFNVGRYGCSFNVSWCVVLSDQCSALNVHLLLVVLAGHITRSPLPLLLRLVDCLQRCVIYSADTFAILCCRDDSIGNRLQTLHSFLLLLNSHSSK